MKFTKAACLIISKINTRDKNTTLMIFLFCQIIVGHYRGVVIEGL